MNLYRTFYRLWLIIRWKKRLKNLANERVPLVALRRAPQGRKKSLQDQFKLIKADFGGKSELTFLLYCCVIKARRDIHPIRQAELIRFCFKHYGDILFRDLNTRWLVSFLNTVSDHGPNGEAQAARAVTTFIHMMKIYESLFQYQKDQRSNFVAETIKYGNAQKPWNEPQNFPNLELWDYMFMMAFDTGDVIDNLFIRLQDSRYPFVNSMLDFALQKIGKSETVFAEILKRNRYTKSRFRGTITKRAS